MPQFAKVSNFVVVLYLPFCCISLCFAARALTLILTTAQEEMDMEAFGMLDDEDLQEMGIAKGPRLKLLQAISQVANSSRT